MKKRRVVYIVASIIVGVIFIMSIPSLAKYITDKIHSYFIRGKNFFFTSDLLNENTASYQIGTWSGVGQFSVAFNLYSKDNELLFTENDISYTVEVECSSDVVCTSSKSSGILYMSDVDHTDTITITVVPQRVFVADEVVNIKVTVQSTSPYEKTLKGEFNYLVGRDGVSYHIEDEVGRAYLFLKVTNDIDYCTVTENFSTYHVGDRLSSNEYRALNEADLGKCVSRYLNVSFNPSTVLLDSTSNILETSTYTTTVISGTNYINGFVYKIAPSSAFQIKFYKNNPTINYENSSVLNISVTE